MAALARTRVSRFNRRQLAAGLALLVWVLMLLSGTIYNAAFLRAAREGWPVVSQIVKLVVRDEFAQRDRYLRENLDAMAQKVGESIASLMVPNSRPLNRLVGSGFGFRSHPFTGRSALHTRLDFPAESGTPIVAAAGGVVRSADNQTAYGNLLEIDHGNSLATRYAHTPRKSW